MKKKLCVLLMVMLALALALPSVVFAEKVIKIGVIYPLTGGAAAAGRELRAGAELAAQLCNEARSDIDMTMAKSAGIQSMGGAKIS
jgi:branched-chain amino acid transport system substrate-binding protein